MVRHVNADKVLGIHVEMTGYNANDEPLQIAIANAAGNVLFNQYIKPESRKRWSTLKTHHGITPSMVKNARTFDCYKAEIERILRQGEILCSYGLVHLSVLEWKGVSGSKTRARKVNLQEEFVRHFREKTKEDRYWEDEFGEWHRRKYERLPKYESFFTAVSEFYKIDKALPLGWTGDAEAKAVASAFLLAEMSNSWECRGWGLKVYGAEPYKVKNRKHPSFYAAKEKEKEEPKAEADKRAKPKEQKARKTHSYTKEEEDLILNGYGKSQSEIAKIIGVTPKAVERKRASLKAKR